MAYWRSCTIVDIVPVVNHEVERPTIPIRSIIPCRLLVHVRRVWFREARRWFVSPFSPHEKQPHDRI